MQHGEPHGLRRGLAQFASCALLRWGDKVAIENRGRRSVVVGRGGSGEVGLWRFFSLKKGGVNCKPGFVFLVLFLGFGSSKRPFRGDFLFFPNFLSKS